jgi:flagellar M-ring protein FliF
MKERFRILRQNLQEMWTKMTERNRKIVLGAAAALGVGIIAAIVFLVVSAQKPGMSVLYSNLSGNDAHAVVETLQKDGVKYEIADDGKTIKVPQNKVPETRISMAAEGLPTGGTAGFELFDETRLGVTDFTQKVNLRRALQGELQRTIVGLDAVESARVMIVQPEPSLFVTEQQEPSASVAVKLKDPKEGLSDEQINGIMNLVASSIEGMSAKNVTIIDSNGNLLSDLEEKKKDAEKLAMTALQLKQKREIEELYKRDIIEYLAKVFGEENVVVMVKAELDFSKTKKENIVYEPIRPGADAGVIRSEQLIDEKYLGTGTVPEIGVPGTTSNIPGYKGLAEGNAEYKRTEETRNYEITEYRTWQEKAQGDISRLQVAVILNEGLSNKEGEQYPRAPLIRDVEENLFSAANLDRNRGDSVDVKVFNFKMDEQTGAVRDLAAAEARRRYIIRLISYAIAGLAILAMLILGWIALKNVVVPEELPEEEPEEEIIEEPVPVEELDIPELTSEQRMREKILEEVLRMINDDPEGAALIVRSWMFDEDR